jgi:hypothetical protein
MIVEGLISEDVDYDDWICDASTWLNLGIFHEICTYI